MQEESIAIQYVPPHNHRANPAERGIQTAKNHLISALSGTHANFPANLWDKILPQVELTMNILRPFAADRTISAYEGVFRRKYDFEAHPMAPCGTLVLVHDPPDKRGTFASHGSPGFYLGPALLHHRCFRVHMLATQSERISDSLAWFPAPLVLPGSSPAELLTAAVTDLTAAMNAVAHSTHISAVQMDPFKQLALTATAAIHQAADMFIPPNQTSSDGAMVTQVADYQDDRQQRVVVQPRAPDDETAIPAQDPTAPVQRVEPEGIIAEIQPQIPVTGAQRPQRARTIPQRYRGAAHATVSDRANRVEHSQVTAVVDEFLQSEPPGPEPPALFDELMAVDLKAICAPLTYKETKSGLDRALWEIAESEELIRLIVESETMRFIQKDQKPRDRIDSYANPQPSIKIKNGIEVRRMRMAVSYTHLTLPTICSV